jgi:rfaE bifunctional protein nucleotidyltransferase chain/domain
MLLHQQLTAKLQRKEDVLKKVEALKANRLKVVFTNGCFDLLHPGHVDYLAQARDAGDYLVVGLNTDASVQRLNKAPNRPVNSQQARALVLSGLASVDAVVLFDEDTPYELISYLKPDVLVKGNDYTIETIVGHDVVQAAGGQVITIPLLQGYSTTAIIQKIKS